MTWRRGTVYPLTRAHSNPVSAWTSGLASPPKSAEPEDGNSGAAYVYRFDGGTWVEEAKLTASDAAELDHLGGPVSISGDIVVTGCIPYRTASQPILR